MVATQHPLLDEAAEFYAALLALEASIPEPSPRAGELEIPEPGKQRRRRRKPGIVTVPGSGQAVTPNVDTITRHTPQGQQPHSGPNTNSFEGLPGGGGSGLPGSGGGGGGAW